MFVYIKEPEHVPRTAVLIKPKPAYIALVNTYEATQEEPLLLSAEDLEGKNSFVILLPEDLGRKEMRDYLRRHIKPLLRYLLQIDIEDKKYWPKTLSFEEFETLFSWEPAPNVGDIADL